MAEARPAPARVYRVLRAAEWDALLATGLYRGNATDARDGFIHLSSREQVAGTIDRHFAGETGLVVVEIDAARLGERLRWEPSRGGVLFPHLYGVLTIQAVVGPVDAWS
jgi:uncharacterized protein (DUF952 family)